MFETWLRTRSLPGISITGCLALPTACRGFFQCKRQQAEKRHGGKLVVKSCHLCIEGKPPCGFHHPAASPLTQQPDTVSRSCQDEGRITLYASSLLSLWLLSRGLYHHGRSGGQAGLQFGCRQAGMLARVAPCHGITVMQHVPFSGLSLRQPRGKRGR